MRKIRPLHWLLMSLALLALLSGLAFFSFQYLQPTQNTFSFLRALNPHVSPGTMIQATGMTATSWSQEFEFRQEPAEVLRFLEQHLTGAGKWTMKTGRSGQISFREAADPRNVILLFDNGKGEDYGKGYRCRVFAYRPASKRELTVGF